MGRAYVSPPRVTPRKVHFSCDLVGLHTDVYACLLTRLSQTQKVAAEKNAASAPFRLAG
jgi:hypothetical protein